MKLWWLFIITLLILPGVSAIINVDGPSRDVFNLGDKINIKGYVLETSDTSGLFKLTLSCKTVLPLVTKAVSLKKDEKFVFEESLNVPVYLEGDCTIEASVEVNGNIIEQIKSRNFQISKNLDGRFKVKENLIQLGKDISLEGNVFKLDGTNVNGLATLYFKLNNNIVFVDSVNIVDGKLSYVKDSMAQQAGVYGVDISVLDSYGNQFDFVSAVQFTLVNEIYVFAKPAEVQVIPGTMVYLIGEAKTILQDDIEEGDVVITLDDKTYETTITNSRFSYDISLAENIKSGKHVIKVSVEDNLGNKGNTETEIDVTPVPTELKVEIPEGVYVPGSKLTLKPILTDQGGDFIIEDISVEIIDANGDSVLSSVVKTNEEIIYDFSQYAKPGAWEIKTYATGLSHEDQLNLGETISADFSLANQTLTITNTGNIKYKKPIELIFTADGVTKNVIEKISLNPEESTEFDLGKYVDSGVYSLQVGDKTFTEINITKVTKRNYDWVYWAVIILFLLLLIYLFLFRKKRFRNLIKKRKEEIKVVGPAEKHEIKEKKENVFEEATKRKYAKEFRDRILKEIEKRKPHFKTFKRQPIEEEGKPSPVKASDLVEK